MSWDLYLLGVLGYVLFGMILSRAVESFTTEGGGRQPMIFHVVFGPVVAFLAICQYLDQSGWPGFGWATFIVEDEHVLMFVMGLYFSSFVWSLVCLKP